MKASIRYVRGTLPSIEGERDIAVLDGDPCASSWVEETRRLDHDQNMLPLVGEFIRPDSVVYDVGAYIGDHTAYYASRAALVVAFEPMPDAFEALEFNTKLYRNVLMFNCPLGNGERVAIDHEDISTEKNFGARFLAKREDGAATIRLDDIGTSVLHPPSLLKLDVEGWEVNVLRGAEVTIKKHKPVIVCEVNRGALFRVGTSPAELHGILKAHGYTLRDLGTKKEWKPDDEREQFDVIATEGTK
jgi:FkbM family methyltransferase